MVKVISLEFEELQRKDLPRKQGIKVLYQAPHNGPRFWVDHYNVQRGLPLGKVREDIRIAFAKIIGGAVVGREDGYYMRADNTRVKWSQETARFYPMTEEEILAEQVIPKIEDEEYPEAEED